MKKIVVSGYFGFDNSGDDAILKAMVDDFKKLNIDLEITALSNNPEKTRQVYGIGAVNRFSFSEVRRALKDADLLLSCLLYTSPSPRDISGSRMPSSA